MKNLKKKTIYCCMFFTLFNLHSQEVDIITSATSSPFGNFLKKSYEKGAKIASQGIDMELVVKSIPNIYKSDYPFGFPLKNKALILKDYNRELHSGYDIKLSKGSDVVSTGIGHIIQIDYFPKSYGNCIVIQHDSGFFTLYGQLDKVIVKVGQLVDAREKIGELGQTGFATEPHLHYGIFHGKEWDRSLSDLSLSLMSINPYEFINN